MAGKKVKVTVPYRADEYTYRVQWDGEHFLALVEEMPGLSAFGPTQEKALSELRGVVSASLKWMAEEGDPLPEPLSRRAYSGRIIVRMAPALHRRLAQEAQRAGISLNQFITSRLDAA